MFSFLSKNSTQSNNGTGYGGDTTTDGSKLIAGRKRAMAKGQKQDKATMEYLSEILRDIYNGQGALLWIIPPTLEQKSSLDEKKSIRENINKLTDTIRMTIRNQVPAEWENEQNQSCLSLRAALDICKELIRRCNQNLDRADVTTLFGNPESPESLLYSLREISSEADLIAKRAALEETSDQNHVQIVSSSDSSLSLATQILKVRRTAERLVRKKKQNTGCNPTAAIDNDDSDDDDGMFVMSEKDIYTRELGLLRFDMVPTLYHHSFGALSRGSLNTRAVFKELAAYKTALPVEFGGSIFVRAVHDRLDLLRALIIGPDDTPYANGCFIFDIHLPSQYPAVPPKVQFMTTGGGKVRFNPNLYNCGKVCLSLLGTWEGPGWVSGESTLLQVLVSIQSLILVPDPYFNEPGYERTQHTVGGKQKSLAYNKDKRGHTLDVCIKPFLQYALGTHSCPYPEFKNIITQHFFHKRRIIQRQLQQWTKEDGSALMISKLKSINGLLTKLQERESQKQKEEAATAKHRKDTNVGVIELLDNSSSVTPAAAATATTMNKQHETIILDLASGDDDDEQITSTNVDPEVIALDDDDNEKENDSKPSARKRARVAHQIDNHVVELLDD